MTKRRRRTYDWRTKSEVVLRIRRGARPARVAREMQMTRTNVYTWLRQAEDGTVAAKIARVRFRFDTVRAELAQLEDARRKLEKGD